MPSRLPTYLDTKSTAQRLPADTGHRLQQSKGMSQPTLHRVFSREQRTFSSSLLMTQLDMKVFIPMKSAKVSSNMFRGPKGLSMKRKRIGCRAGSRGGKG